jgi:hypothetical protein
MTLKLSFTTIAALSLGVHKQSSSNPAKESQQEITMKVMAFGTLKPLTPEQQQKYMPTEVPDTLKLYLSGKIEQFWLREGMAGTIFLMNVESVAEAKTLLGALPLTAANLLTFDLMQVGPLSPLGMLIH